MNKHLSDGLDRSDTVAHTKAVYFALNNLQTGEVAEWYNDANSSHGKAQIKMTWTASGEVCRMIYSYVITRRNSFTYEDKACYNNARHTWNFVDKY
jgi:surface antigen